MKIESASQIALANERFNYFHDGYLRRIALTRDTEFFEVEAVGGRPQLENLWKNGTTIELDICHSNYDCPNQPKNRLVKIRASACVSVVEKVERFVGTNLIDLRFGEHPQGVECLFLQHAKGEGNLGIEKGVQISLFVARGVEIEETTLT